MIDSATISIQYIKKDDFTGSYKGMRYRLSKSGDNMEVSLESLILMNILKNFVVDVTHQTHQKLLILHLHLLNQKVLESLELKL